jgi:hypothetical protein
MFIRWGMLISLAGILLTLTAFRGLKIGAILVIVGVALYYYGRFARKERIFVSKSK